MNAYTSFWLGWMLGIGMMGMVMWACYPRAIKPQQQRRWRGRLDDDEHATNWFI